MLKDSPSDGGRSPPPLRTPRQSPHKIPCQHFIGSGAKSNCSPSSPFHEDHRQELEMLRAKLDEERLRSREARRRFAIEAQELRQAAEHDRQLLADQLRSKWEQQRARELHQLRETTQRQREAEIRQLMRWKEAELREAQEVLQQERDAAMRQARDLQRQLARELVSRGSNSRGEGGGSSGGLSAECQAKLQEVMSKLRWEVDGDQATKIRHLKAELELERRLFLKYILERFEGETLPAGSLPRLRQAPSPQHPGGARPRSLESLIAACTPKVTEVSRSCPQVNNHSRCEPLCQQPPVEERGPTDSCGQEQPDKKAVGKALDVKNEPKREAFVDSPPDGKVNSWGAAGECALEVLPQQGWLSGNNYNQLMKQNTDLSNALVDLERRNTYLMEENKQLRKSSFPGKVEWLKRKTAELSAIAKQLDESSKKFQLLSLLKQCENLRREAKEKQKRCDETEEKLKTALNENSRMSKENLQLQEKTKRAEKGETENADLKAKLIQATEERNSALQLTEGLKVKIENLEQGMKERAESQQQLKAEHETTLLELQKKDEEIQRLQQAQTEMKRQYEEEVQLLDAQVKELQNQYHSQTGQFKLLSQELEQSQIKKSWILGSESSPATCNSIEMSSPEKRGHDTFYALPCSDNTHVEDCAPTVSVDLIKSPFKIRAFLARYSYDPFSGPNKNPEAELPLTAGEYVYVCGDMDENGFYLGELMDGRRGLVPSNFVEEAPSNDLMSFIPSEPSDISYNSLLETSFPCQSASSGEKSSSQDEDMCASLPSKKPKGTLCEVQAAVPHPQNLTLIKQSRRSIIISWDPPQMPDGWGEVLSYNIYVNTELHQNVKYGSERKTVIEDLDLKSQTYRISVQSVTDQGNSDKMQCSFLVGNTFHIDPTFLILQNITPTSAEITWLPSNYTHTVYLNEKECDVTKAGISCYTFQNLKPNTQYSAVMGKRGWRELVSSASMEPLMPKEALVYPQEQKSTEVTFTTPTAGPPDAPIDVQVEAGPSADVLVISWLPVTIHPSGSSNGVRVTGYAIYISGQKVTEIMSPTAGSISLEVSQIKMLQGPQIITVRTISPFGESADSVPALIPSTLLDAPSTLSSKSIRSGLTFKGCSESEGQPVPATTCTSSSSFSHMCVSSADTSFTIHFTTDCKDSVGPLLMNSISQNQMSSSHSHTRITSHIVRSENNGDSILRISVGKKILQESFPTPWQEGSANSTATVGEALTEDTNKKISKTCLTKNVIIKRTPDNRKVCVMTEEDSACHSFLEDCDANHWSPELGLSSVEFELRKDKEVSRHNICVQEGPDIFHEKDQMKRIQQSCKEVSTLTASEVEKDEDIKVEKDEDIKEEEELPFKKGQILKDEAPEDKTLILGTWWSNLGDHSHNSDLSDITEEEEADQEHLSTSGEHVKPQEKPALPTELAKDNIINMTLKADQTMTDSVSNSSPQRNVAAEDSINDDAAKLFVALYDYDPITMSPNSDADEELPFKKGQILKVAGDQDADGFYTGECEGKKGLIPSNMVSEMLIDSVEVKNQLLKKAYEG